MWLLHVAQQPPPPEGGQDRRLQTVPSPPHEPGHVCAHQPSSSQQPSEALGVRWPAQVTVLRKDTQKLVPAP